jgi:hypothetical protein
MECANNNEILCNDIRENMYWSGIVIDYDYYWYDCHSSGNAIHFNNIVGNLDYGIYNYNTGNTVDATDNWWGAVDGPSHSPGHGDKVSDHVEYSPWLPTEVQCEECTERVGDPTYTGQLLTYTAGQTSGHGASPRLVPPSFSAQYMNIHPLQTNVNQPVTITTNVVNSGQEAGNYDVVLRINGKPEQNKMVSVGPGGTYPVKFTVTKSQPGTYAVNIGGQQATFTVLGDAKIVRTPVNGGLIAIFIMSLLIIVTAVMLIRTFRHSTP